jgi:putative transposase
VPANQSVAEVAHRVKTNSSRWVHGRNRTVFAWQTGYGAFTVSESGADAVRDYISNQQEPQGKVVSRGVQGIFGEERDRRR